MKILIAQLKGDETEMDSLFKETTQMEQDAGYDPGPPFIAYPSFEHYGDWLLTKGRYEEALIQFDRSLENRVNRSNALRGKLQALKALGRDEEALDCYNKALEIEPDDWMAWHHNKLKIQDIERNVETIFKSNNWQKGFEKLDQLFYFVINPKDSNTENIVEYINIIFHSTIELQLWQERVEKLVGIYYKYGVVSALSKGIVENIPQLMDDIISDRLARNWLEVWQTVAGEKEELSIALGMLKTAVEYKETKGDRRVLFQLPKEQRDILEPLVNQNM